jgi:hypothetical protein
LQVGYWSDAIRTAGVMCRLGPLQVLLRTLASHSRSAASSVKA